VWLWVPGKEPRIAVLPRASNNLTVRQEADFIDEFFWRWLERECGVLIGGHLDLSNLGRQVEVEVTLRLTVGQSVCLGIEHPCGTCDQVLLPVGMLLSEIYGLVSVGLPLWREDGSVICSAITERSESRRTRNHTLLSHLRLPQPGGPGSRIYILQEQGGPVIPPGTRFPLRRLLRLAGLVWRYPEACCELLSFVVEWPLGIHVGTESVFVCWSQGCVFAMIQSAYKGI
jgi:hypothetical protein